jgi:hypothetical protein
MRGSWRKITHVSKATLYTKTVIQKRKEAECLLLLLKLSITYLKENAEKALISAN